MSPPACSIYVHTVDGQRFGPYTLHVELTPDWKIVGTFLWENESGKTVLLDRLVMLSPIGVKIFDGNNVEVVPSNIAKGDITVVNQLQTTWNDVVDDYLRGFIDVEGMERRLDETQPD